MTAQLLPPARGPYWGNWSVINGLDALTLGREIHAVEWNFFFMAEEGKSHERYRNLNSLEVTKITAKRFLGVSYASVFGTFTPCPTELLLG